MREALRVFWTERSARGRVSISAAVILIVLAIGYAYVWLPVTRELDRLLIRVPELRADAQVMERDISEFETLKVTAGRAVGLEAAIRQANATIRLPDAALEIVQQNPTRIRVGVVSAHADQALSWLAVLQSMAGVRIESVRLTSLSDGDRVKIETILGSGR